MGPPAFVFDIDGVLIRGKNVLAAARKAMEQVRAAGGSAKLPRLLAASRCGTHAGR